MRVSLVATRERLKERHVFERQRDKFQSTRNEEISLERSVERERRSITITDRLQYVYKESTLDWLCVPQTRGIALRYNYDAWLSPY